MKRILLSVFMTCSLCNMVYGTQQHDVVIPERENILSSLDRNEMSTEREIYKSYDTIIDIIEARFIRGATTNTPITNCNGNLVSSISMQDAIDNVSICIENARIARQCSNLQNLNLNLSGAIRIIFNSTIGAMNTMLNAMTINQRHISTGSLNDYGKFAWTIYGYCQNQTLEHLSANEKERLISCFFSAWNSLLDIISIEDGLFVANEEFDRVTSAYLADAYNGLRAWHTNVTIATRGTIDELNNHLHDNVHNSMMTRIGDAHDDEENPSIRRVIDQINEQQEDVDLNKQTIDSAYLALAYINVGDQLAPMFDITNKLKSRQYDRLCILKTAIKLAQDPRNSQQIGDELKNSLRSKFNFYNAANNYMERRNFFNLFQGMSNKVRALRTEISNENYLFNGMHGYTEHDLKNLMLDTYGKIKQYNTIKDIMNQRHANQVLDLSAKLTSRIQMYINGNLVRNNRTVSSYLLCNYIVDDLFKNVREQFFADNMM